MSSSGFIAGLTTGRRRAHTPRALFISSFALVLAALVAVAERRVEWFGAASRALSGVVFGLLIPVALVATSGQVLFPTRLAASATFFARFGASRRSVALGLVVASMCTAAILAAAMGAVTALIAHDPTAPPPAADALTTAWIGLFTGAAYAGLYAFGATFGAKGGGRYWALVLDLLLGAGGMTSALAPRAHAQNLLGGAPPLMFSQSQSAAALLVLAALTTLLALARLPP